MHSDGAHGIPAAQLAALKKGVCTRALEPRHFYVLALYALVAIVSAVYHPSLWYEAFRNLCYCVAFVCAFVLFEPGPVAAVQAAVCVPCIYLLHAIVRECMDGAYPVAWTVHLFLTLCAYTVLIRWIHEYENRALWRAYLGVHAVQSCAYHAECLCDCALCADAECPQHAKDTPFGVAPRVVARHRGAVWRAENSLPRNAVYVAVQYVAVAAFLVPAYFLIEDAWVALPCVVAGAVAVQLAFAAGYRALDAEFDRGVADARPWIHLLFPAVLGALVAFFWTMVHAWADVLDAWVIACIAAAGFCLLLIVWTNAALGCAHRDDEARWAKYVAEHRSSACPMHAACLCACPECLK